MYNQNNLKVTVNTANLLATLKANRAKHEKNYKLAKEGFRILLIKELEKKLKQAIDGKKVELSFKNQKPTNCLNDYDDVIGMIELSQDEEMIIDHEQYKQYIKNEWDWTAQWLNSNLMSLSAASANI